MPPLDFPNSPAVGQSFQQWKWTGSAWDINTSGVPGYLVGPGLKLDSGTSPATIDVVTPYLPLTGGTLSGTLIITPSGDALIRLNGTNNNLQFLNGGVYKWAVYTDTSNNFGIWDQTHSTSPLVVLASGQINIGETGSGVSMFGATPVGSNELTVNGPVVSINTYPLVRLRNTGAPVDQKITEWYSDPSIDFQGRFVNDAYNNAQSFIIVKRNTGTFTVKEVDFPNGNVGIGTTAPGVKLHVVGTNTNAIAVIAGTTKSVRIGADSQGGVVEGVDQTGLTSYQPLKVGGSAVYLQYNGANRIWFNNPNTVFVQGQSGYDGILLFRSDQVAYLTLIPESAANTATIGYYNTSTGWASLIFQGSVALGGTTLGFSGYTGAAGGTGGPCIYGDGSWILVKPGSGNQGLLLWDYNGSTRAEMRTDGTFWAMGTGSPALGQFRMMSNNAGGGYGSGWYNDASSTYLLLTNNNDSQGTYNGLRPFRVDMSNGNIYFGHYTTANDFRSENNVYAPNGYGYFGQYVSAVGNLNVGGYSYMNGGARAYNGGSDPFEVFAPNGAHARTRYHSSATRIWSVGTVNWGSFYIADETAGVARLEIKTNGDFVIMGQLLTTQIYVANNNYIWFSDTNGAWRYGLILASDNQFYLSDGSLNVIIRTPALHISGGSITVDNGGVYSNGIGGFFHNDREGAPISNQIVTWGMWATQGVWRLWESSEGDRILADRNCSIWPANNAVAQCGTGNNAWLQVCAVQFIQTQSDPAIKRDIEPVAPMLDKIRALQPFKFRFNIGADTENLHHGFMAPDVRDIFGEDFGGYYRDPKTGTQGLVYNELVTVLWKAVQELAEKVETLEGKLAATLH